MGAFVVAFARAFLGNASDAGSANESLQVLLLNTRALLAQTAHAAARILGGIMFTLQQEKGAWRGATGRGAGAGDDVNSISGATRGSLERLVNTIIPRSLSWLDGWLMSREITPIKKRLATDESTIRFLLGWRGQIDAWRNNTIDPEIVKDRAFRDYYYGPPKAAVDKWVEWFRHPGDFADWAIAPLIGPMIAYFADPDHIHTRDSITDIIVKASPDVSRSVEAAAVAILLKEQ